MYIYIYFVVLYSLDIFFFFFFFFFLVLRNEKILAYTLFSVKVTNIYPSFIADDARIMAKRPVVLK